MIGCVGINHCISGVWRGLLVLRERWGEGWWQAWSLNKRFGRHLSHCDAMSHPQVMSHVQIDGEIDRHRTWKLTCSPRWITPTTIVLRLFGLKPLIININGWREISIFVEHGWVSWYGQAAYQEVVCHIVMVCPHIVSAYMITIYGRLGPPHWHCGQTSRKSN